MNRFAHVGLYSISVRGLDIPELLAWAASEHIPFVHLRGGKRGFDLAACDSTTLRRWRDVGRDTVPITGVTADTDLADLLDPDASVRRSTGQDVARLADAARSVGAGWLRLLARKPQPQRATTNAARLPETAVTLLIEPHHPNWLTTAPHAALMELVRARPYPQLLADTTQLAYGLTRAADTAALDRLDDLLVCATVVHLSHHDAAVANTDVVTERAARRLVVGQQIEVAVEWTGADRSPEACLTRYRQHSDRWVEQCARIAEVTR